MYQICYIGIITKISKGDNLEQCSRHSTLGKNTKQTFFFLLVASRSSCSKYATKISKGDNLENRN
jgi:hypothetical protein